MKFFAVLLLAVLAGRLDAGPVDKTQIAAYVRYVEGFTDEVNIAVDDPVASAYPGYSRVLVHLTAGKTDLGDKTYYIAPSGDIIDGHVWKLGESPFEQTLKLLPQNDPSFGPADATVTIVAFSDFECPYCRQFASSVRENLPKSYPNSVRLVFADFPLEAKHLWARAAAEAAHCIGDGHVADFWTFHDWMFQHQTEIDPSGSNLRQKILAFAKDQGWDTVAIGSCMDSHAKSQEVSDSEKLAGQLGVQQTPTLFVDGRKVEGALPWPNLQRLIEFELKRPAQFR